jgi:hypothetical protein
MPQAIRSVLAIIAGYLTMAAIVGICTLLCIGIFHLQSGHPTTPYLAANVVFSALAAFTGGWLAAYIAGYKPLLHGAVLAVLLLLVSGLVLRHPAPGQSVLYQVSMALLMPLAVLAGAATEKS